MEVCVCKATTVGDVNSLLVDVTVLLQLKG
jgi:hypothetical protein